MPDNYTKHPESKLREFLDAGERPNVYVTFYILREVLDLREQLEVAERERDEAYMRGFADGTSGVVAAIKQTPPVERQWRVSFVSAGMKCEDPFGDLKKAISTAFHLSVRGDRYKDVCVQFSDDQGNTWTDAPVDKDAFTELNPPE